MVDPERPGKRRFDLPMALAVIVLLLAIAIAPWALPIPYR
jgi:hypothetical protein